MIFLYSYFVMLIVGAAHSLNARVPALGYLTVLALAAAVHIVVYSGSRDAQKTDKQ